MLELQIPEEIMKSAGNSSGLGAIGLPGLAGGGFSDHSHLVLLRS